MFDTAVARERVALTGLALAMLMASLDTSMTSAALPRLAAAFGASFADAQWILLAYLVPVTALSVAAGRLGDIYGRRDLLLAGTALFGAGAMASATATALWMLIVARAVQGVAAALITSLALALAADRARSRSAARSMGQLAAMSAIGTTVGPVLSGLFAGTRPQSVFLLDVPLVIAAFVLTRAFQTEERVMRQSAATGNWRAIAGTMRDRAVAIAVSSNAIVATVIMATLIVGPFYLRCALGLTARRAGMVLSAGPAMAALTSLLAGGLIERAGSVRAIAGGLGLIVAGSASLAVLPRSLGGYVTAVLTITAGYAVFQTANNARVVSQSGSARRGVAGGLLGLSRNLGLIAGTSVMGAIFLRGTGVSDLTAATADQVTGGMRAVFAVSAAIVALVLFVHRSFASSLVNPSIQRN
jgi:MFS family permease